MSIEIKQDNGICILRCEGRILTGSDSEELRSKADEIKQLNCNRLLVDLTGVTSIGSTGIGFIVGLYTTLLRVPDGRFVVAGAQSRVREIFDLTRLSSIIPMAPDVSAGRAMLAGAGAHGR